MLPRINAAIGHIRLDRLQPHHLMQFYSNLEEAGIREDGKQHFKGDLWQMLRARSITKTAFAEQAGVSLAVLASITQGKNVSAESAGAFLTRWGSLWAHCLSQWEMIKACRQRPFCTITG